MALLEYNGRRKKLPPCRQWPTSSKNPYPVIMFKGRGKNQARSNTQKMGPLNNVNKLFRYVHKRRDGNISAEVSQPRLHNQNVNAGCSPLKVFPRKSTKN